MILAVADRAIRGHDYRTHGVCCVCRIRREGILDDLLLEDPASHCLGRDLRGVFRRRKRLAPARARHPAPLARSAHRQATSPQGPASAAPSRIARQASSPSAHVPVVTEMIRWREGPGGLAFQACLSDVHDLSSLWSQVTADLTNNVVHVLCARFQADVSAALAAPAMPDPQARSALAMALSAAQRAIEDLRIGLDLRNAAVLRQAGAQWDVAGAHLREMTARIRAITPASTP